MTMSYVITKPKGEDSTLCKEEVLEKLIEFSHVSTTQISEQRHEEGSLVSL